MLQQLRAFAARRHTRAKDNPPRAAASRPAPAPRRPEFARLDAAGDSLGRALQAYNGRMRLFEQRKLDCPALGRGMVRVEGAVARYGMQRNTTRATLDANYVARDRELRAAVDAAGRQFQRSRCGHP